MFAVDSDVGLTSVIGRASRIRASLRCIQRSRGDGPARGNPSMTPDGVDAAAMLEALPVAAWATDPAGMLVACNRAARALLGPGRDAWPAAVAAADRAGLDDALRGAGEGSMRLRIGADATWREARWAPGPDGLRLWTATEPPGVDAALRDGLDLFPSPALLVETGSARILYANRAADALAGGEFPRAAGSDAYRAAYVCTDGRGRRIPDDEMPGVRVARGERVEAFEMDWRTPAGTRSLLVFADVLPSRDGAAGEALVVFNDVTELKRSTREQWMLGQRFSLLVDQAPFSVQILGRDGRTTRVNRAFVDLWGIDLDALHDYNLLADPQLEAAGIAATIRSVFAGGPPRLLPPIPYRPDRGVRLGREIWTQALAYAVKDTDGSVLEVVLVHQDITEARRREEALRQRTEDLEHVNADLQQFVYVASHDLQEPLRMVSQFLGLLLRRASPRLEAEERRWAEQAMAGATRMQGLIRDVLDYARIGRDPAPRERLPADEVLDEALANLQAAIAEAGAEIARSPLPVIPGVRSALLQVFQNLVGNALKFRDARRPARVEIAASVADGEARFVVRDNGIGIAPEQRERVFAMFQRLHEREVYPGSGVGLAVCRRIIAGAGGRMWIDDGIDGGTAVVFTWPL